MLGPIYSILENKLIYNLSQALLAPNGVRNLRRQIDPCLAFDDSRSYRVLELGCGTGYFSVNRPNVQYVGTDVNAGYFLKKSTAPHMTYQVMDAVCLAFPDASFDLVYSVGLYHHLTDEQTRASLQESMRVLAPGGRIVLVDNIRPTRLWNLYARLIRRLDRGDHVRGREHILNLVRESGLTIDSVQTFYFTFTGLEAMILQIKK